ncbi:MAG: hypothetical protein WC732_09625 [Candidatus Omnitrophota bacterium]
MDYFTPDEPFSPRVAPVVQPAVQPMAATEAAQLAEVIERSKFEARPAPAVPSTRPPATADLRELIIAMAIEVRETRDILRQILQSAQSVAGTR